VCGQNLIDPEKRPGMLHRRGTALAQSLPTVSANRHREYRGGGETFGSARTKEPLLPFDTCRLMQLVDDCAYKNSKWAI